MCTRIHVKMISYSVQKNCITRFTSLNIGHSVKNGDKNGDGKWLKHMDRIKQDSVM